MISDIADQLRRALAGTYALERELEGAGMSRLFVAEELSLGRKVVVKVLPPELAAAVNVERFRREIQLAARLQHPNIVPVLATGVSEGLPYYTMPLIDGESLRARLARSGELPINETLRILSDVLSALDCAHAHGIVHRDIKPGNVMLTGHRAVVADFGIAKALSASTNSDATLTSRGVAIGTPAYMAPEQAVADPTTDHRADLYAVGAIGYEMLTGQHVFSGRPAQAVLVAHAIEQPEDLSKRRPSVPPALASLIMRALEKRPADRPQSAGEMLATIEALPTSSGISSWERTTKRWLTRSSDRRGVVMAVFAAVVLLFLTSSSWYWYRHRQLGAIRASSAASASLVVLPFENLGKPEDAYFADGMAEEISTKLGALSGLRVIGRQSARSYSHSDKPIPQIGKELGVEYILTGSVRWDRSRPGRNVVRISPTLLRASDGTQLWSDPYEDQYVGLFDLQSKVAQRVASALQLQLSAGDQRSLTSRLTDNLEAYDYYLRGKALLEKGGGPDVLRSVPLLERATRLDQKFAMAFTMLGLAHTRAFWLSADPTQHRLQLAKNAIDSALTLDQQLPAAHAALGNYYFEGFLDSRRALAEFDRAVKLSPDDAQVLMIKGRAERRVGDWKKAIADLRRAASLEPRSLSIHATLAVTLLFTRNYEAADSVARLAIGIDSSNLNGYSTRAGVAIQRGDVKTAAAFLLDAASKVDPDQLPNDILSSYAWALSTDSRLSAIAHKASVPTARGAKLDFFLNKGVLARFEKDSAGLLAAGDSILALAPSMRGGTFLDDDLHKYLGFAHAARGEKQKALAESRLGVNAYPYTRDAVAAAVNRQNLAAIASWMGDNDLAIATYEELLQVPAAVSRSFLRTVPLLEPLRNDPRFQRLISGN